MAGVHPLPTHGGVFLDDRGEERSLRVSWHPEVGFEGLVVLSIWRADACVATFRLGADEVEGLITTLREALGPSTLRQAQDGAGSGQARTDPGVRHDRAC